MHLKKTHLILVLFCLFCGTVQAQILNVEKARLSGDSSNYFVGNLGLTFNTNNQNIDNDGEAVSFIGLKANADVGYISELHSYLLLSQFNYTATSAEAINSTGYGHLRFNFLRERRLSYETFAQLQYDQGRGMEVRWLGGGGVRYNFLRKDKVRMFFGIGGMHEQEVWNVPGDRKVQRSLFIWKASNYISSRITVNEYVNLNIITYYQTGYDFDREFFRHRINADLNLNIRIGTSVALSTTIFGAYENRPVVPISKFVYAVSNGVTLSF